MLYLLLRAVQGAAVIVFFLCALWVFVVPYEVWGWIGALAAILLPGLSQIAAMVVAGDPANWIAAGIGIAATIVASVAGSLQVHVRVNQG